MFRRDPFDSANGVGKNPVRPSRTVVAVAVTMVVIVLVSVVTMAATSAAVEAATPIIAISRLTVQFVSHMVALGIAVRPRAAFLCELFCVVS